MEQMPYGSEAMPLWEGAAPHAHGNEPSDIPAITPYLPKHGQRNGAAMVICPGGGYGALAAHEGHDYALWLNALGITCFVLHYRLGSNGYRHPTMLHDAARAMRTVRAQSERWSIDPQRIGIMGSSAGGHLAATLLTQWDAGQADATDAVERFSARPDLGILCYPVISMGPLAHEGSKHNLLGANPPDALAQLLSNELQVTAHTPPCFIWHTWEDQAVPVEHSLLFATALARHGVPFDLHVFQNGQHGLGLNDTPPFGNAHPWSNALRAWLDIQGFGGAPHEGAPL